MALIIKDLPLSSFKILHLPHITDDIVDVAGLLRCADMQLLVY